jgi:hypothetical protein
MGSKGFIRRILPFFATFAVGIFIASFFVTIGPRGNWGGRGKCRHDVRQLRIENEELRNENLRLKNERSTSGWTHDTLDTSESEEWNNGPEVPVEAPPPPPRPRHRR